MDGFLVVLSHSCDDFPMSLHTTRKDAEEAVNRLSWTGMHWETQHPFKRDAATPIAIGILEFRQGWPVGYDTLRHADDEAVE